MRWRNSIAPTTASQTSRSNQPSSTLLCVSRRASPTASTRPLIFLIGLFFLLHTTPEAENGPKPRETVSVCPSLHALDQNNKKKRKERKEIKRRNGGVGLAIIRVSHDILDASRNDMQLAPGASAFITRTPTNFRRLLNANSFIDIDLITCQ